MTDDCAVIVEPNEAVFAVELRTEESEAGASKGTAFRSVIRRPSPSTRSWVCTVRADVEGMPMARSQRVAPCASVRRVSASRTGEPGGTTSTGHDALRTNAWEVPPSTSVRIGP